MANLITIARLILLFVVIAMIHFRPVDLALPSMILLGVVFAGDGIDGWVARKRGSTSPFGAVFDIAGDRIVETVLWVYFAWERVIPLWAPFLVIVRGGIVDALRSMSYDEGMTAFGENTMMRSAFTRWLTAGRFMRGLYGYVKAAAFIFLDRLLRLYPAGGGQGPGWTRSTAWTSCAGSAGRTSGWRSR